jgi:NAD(P)-dependent dehydrogenase (short-subunit alcohol dehydrogenase family)
MNPGKVAIVTGASSGIGRAAAILLGKAGYAVALLGRRQAALEDTARQIAQSGGSTAPALVLPADVAQPQPGRRAVEHAAQHFGRIDALVNVAGYAQLGTIDAITIEDWRRTIDTNLSAVAFLTAAVWPIFHRQNAGIVVNVSSMASIDPFPGFATYASAKAAVNMFTLCTAREGEAIGVRAVAVAPGAVETPMLRSLFNEETIPPGKTLTPEHVGAVIRDCVTGARAFVSGETIQVLSP